MKKKEILYIEELIRDADTSNSPEAYTFIFNKLNEFDTIYSEDYTLEYYKGLMCYSNPDSEEFRVKMAIKYFKRALKLNPQYLMPKIYLGHCYFDIGWYKKASNELKEVLIEDSNWAVLDKNHQSWRIANLAEIVAVCFLKLDRVLKFKMFYQAWKEIYYLNISESRDDFYFPESLVVETSKFLKIKGNSMSIADIAFFRRVSLDLIGLIKSGDGFDQIYSEELKNLRNWNGHEQFQFAKTYSIL